MQCPKNFNEFQQTLHLEIPPSHWGEGLRSIWWDCKGNWEASHNIAQDMHNSLGSWLHAYLHRKEGDTFNAGYWYSKAHRSFPKYSLDAEQKEIVEFILLI